MKKYIFDVPCFYVYEVEAETEDEARKILVYACTKFVDDVFVSTYLNHGTTLLC